MRLGSFRRGGGAPVTDFEARSGVLSIARGIEVGHIFQVTRERIRQLRDRALRRLREGEKGSALESFAA